MKPVRRLAPLAFALVMAACTQSAAPAAVACPPVPSGARPGDAPYGQVWVGTRVNVNGIDEVDPLVARPFFEAVLVQKWVPLPEQGKHRRPTCRSYPGRTAIDGLPGRSYRGTTAILPSNSDPAFAQVTDRN